MRTMRRWLPLAACVCVAVAGCTPDEPTMSPEVALKAAAVRGDVTALAEAIEDGADVDTLLAGAGAIHVAARLDRGDAVRALVQAGADPDLRQGDGDTPAQLAAQSGGADALAALIEAGADVSATGGSEFGNGAAHYAAVSGNVAALEALEAAGVDVLAPNDDGWIAPHQAMCAGRVAAVEWLLDRYDGDLSRGVSCARDLGRQGVLDYVESLG